MTYDDILEFAQKLRPVFPRDSSKMINWLQQAADNQENPREEAKRLLLAGGLITEGCKTSDVALNVIRLIESLKRAPDPFYASNSWTCHTHFFEGTTFFDH